ncbi:MAG: MFS transporter [Acholeplasmataceae bacterium]
MIYRHDSTNKDAFLYTLGGIGDNVFFVFIGSFLLLFYTNLMGISGVVAGSIFMVGRIVDAFTDPLMGSIADKTRTRWGKYRPYIIFGAPVFSMLSIALFIVPGGSTIFKIVYAYGIYLIWGLARTVVQITFISLTALISSDPQKRGKWAAFRQVTGLVGAMIGAAFALPLINLFGGLQQQGAWLQTVIIYAIITLVSYWISAYGTRKMDPSSRVEGAVDESTVSARIERISIKESVRLITQNIPLLFLVLAFSTDSFANAIGQGIGVMFFTHYLGDQGLFTTFNFATMFATLIIAVIIVPQLFKRFSKRVIILFSEALAIIPLVIAFFLPRDAAMAIFVMFLLSFSIQAVAMVTFWAAVPDCSDYSEWKTGKESAGSAASSITFANKLMQAFGIMLAGALLDLTGYHVDNAVQPEAFVNMLINVRVWIPILALIISVLAMIKYPLNKTTIDKMTSDLRKTRLTSNSLSEE